METTKENIGEKIPKKYNPNIVEDKIYKIWEDSGFFNPDKIISEYTKKNIEYPSPFIIILPPPNANDDLHLGHASGYAYQDLMGRYNRMKGRPTLLLPGKDHAGIQTEVVFEKYLEKKEKIKKKDLGRDEFYRRCYEFCMLNAENARSQEKKLGLSADYSREIFTLDEEISEVVMKTFEKMFDEGLIYRGSRIINWCTRCQTALADIDTEHEEQNGIFAYIKYKIVNSDDYITVATTRPETMLGDTAVAVNQNDKRYKKYIGMKCIVPFINREIPIIADYRVDKKFGTGAVKVTPAHSQIDYQIGKDHNLDEVSVIDKYGRMTNEAGERYAGMKVLDCREQLLKDLEQDFLLANIEDIKHSVTVCERCKKTIEPLIQNQWFVDVQKIKGPAKDVVKKGKTKIYPEYKEKIYMNWMENLEDWCISRQLWWGHRIPVWYCGGRDLYDSMVDKTKPQRETAKQGCGHAFVHYKGMPSNCPKCSGKNLEQDPDVLDTWFSSGQLPFSALGGIDGEDFQRFYPGDVLETGGDILTFWVARMILMGTYMTNTTPFHAVHLHGLVTDKFGQKMSKSKGNGIDPTEMREKYGTDALRYSFIFGNAPGQSYRLYEEKIKSFRNFINKIWNGSRFTLMQFGQLDKEEISTIRSLVDSTKDTKRIKSLKKHVSEITRLIDEFRFGIAAEQLYEYWWHKFCDKDIEEIKQSINNLDDQDREEKYKLLAELLKLLTIQLKLLHPFTPFVTEEIWQILYEMGLIEKEEKLLMMASWPQIK